MKKKKNSTPIYIVALVLFAAGLGALLFSASGGGIEVFSVAQARQMPAEQLHAVRLFGPVAENPAPQRNGVNGLTFFIADEKDARLLIQVHYEGIVPDTFQTGIEVYIEGSMQPGALDGVPVFNAGSLRTKCPSKYEKENRN